MSEKHKLTYEDFLNITNGLTNQVADRFCKIYELLANAQSALAMGQIQKQLDYSRNHVGYLLGAKGFPFNPASVLFEQQPISGFWHLSEQGKSCNEYVDSFAADIRNNISRAPVKTEKQEKVSSAKLTVFEEAHAEARLEYQKRIESLEIDITLKDVEIEHLKNQLKASTPEPGAIKVETPRDFVLGLKKIVKDNYSAVVKFVQADEIKDVHFETQSEAADAARQSAMMFCHAIIRYNSWPMESKRDEDGNFVRDANGNLISVPAILKKPE